MNQLFSSILIARIILVASMAVVVKVGMLGASFYLPHTGVNLDPEPEESLYQKYRVARAMGIQNSKKTNKTAAQKAAEAANKKDTYYKLTSLKLKGLYGNEKTAFIMVEDKARKILIISLNEVHKGFKLIKVIEDKAIFLKSGKKYELTFPESKNNKNMKVSKAKPTITNEIEEGEAVFIDRKEIRKYTKKFDQIWKYIKVEQVVENKRLKGFRVKFVKKDSVFDKLGLKKGDMIVGANGKNFKSVSQVFKIYNNMDKIDSLSLKIIRDNQERELEYEINE